MSAPGFLNGLTALANATTNCFPMILISGSSEREIVDLQQGDYEEMDQLAIAKPLCKAAFRVLHAEDIGVGIARAIRAAVSGRPGGVYLDLPAKLFAQTLDADTGKKSLIKVVDPAPRQIPAPEAVQRALDLLKSAKRPLILLGKGAAYAQADSDIRALIERPGFLTCRCPWRKDCCPTRTNSRAAAARSFVLPEADVVAADRRAAELAALAWQGQDLGRQGAQGVGRAEIHPDRYLAAGSRTATCASMRRWSAISDRAFRRCSQRSAPNWPKPPCRVAVRHRRAQEQEHREDGRDAGEESDADEFPQRAERGARHHQGESRMRSS